MAEVLSEDNAGIVQFVVEIVEAVVYGLYLWVLGAIKAICPFRLLPVKNVAQDVVVVTGAGSGIGRLLSLKLSRLGGRLVLLDVNEKGNEETAEMIKNEAGFAKTYQCDISDRQAVYKVAKRIEEEVGVVDVLVNNAGIVNGNYFKDTPDGRLEKCMQINTMAHFWTVKAFLPGMKRRNYGHIVSVVSIAGLSPGVKLVDYCASKFGALGFHESVGFDLYTEGYDGVGTTLVCPWVINTGMFDGFKTKFPSLLPVLEPEYVAQKTVEAFLINQPVLYLPRILYIMVSLSTFLPYGASRRLMHYFGATEAMSAFTGKH